MGIVPPRAVASLSGEQQLAALLKWPDIRDTFLIKEGSKVCRAARAVHCEFHPVPPEARAHVPALQLSVCKASTVWRLDWRIPSLPAACVKVPMFIAAAL